MSYRAADAKFSAHLMQMAGPVRRDHAGFLIIADLGVEPKQRTRAADRTRSKRWRAGTRRARQQIAAARKLGLPNPYAKPGQGFPYGWQQIESTSDNEPTPAHV